jgi:hypothetical protein
MKIILSILIVITVILSSSCNDNNNVEPTIHGWYEVTDTTMVNIPMCLSWPIMVWSSDTTLVLWGDENDTTYKPEYIINNEDEYLELQNLDFNPCNLPYIDFSEVTLIGKYTIVGGSEEPIVVTKLTRNDDMKIYHYQIDVTQMNMDGIPAVIGFSWITFPKPPDDYTIEFGIKRSFNY